MHALMDKHFAFTGKQHISTKHRSNHDNSGDLHTAEVLSLASMYLGSTTLHTGAAGIQLNQHLHAC
jgi:hypothetical protein